MCKAIGLKYQNKVSNIRYGIENYDDKAEFKAKNGSCRRIKRYMIIGLGKYNI